MPIFISFHEKSFATSPEAPMPTSRMRLAFFSSCSVSVSFSSLLISRIRQPTLVQRQAWVELANSQQ